MQDWKTRYQQAHEANFAKQYPIAFADGHYFPPVYPKVKTANGLTTAIVNYLNWSGCRAKRINNMGRLVDTVSMSESGNKFRDKKWIHSAAGKGQADISATIRNSQGVGMSVQIEIKAGRDKPSEHQLLEQSKERAAGGCYEFIYTMEEFYELYDSLTKGGSLL